MAHPEFLLSELYFYDNAYYIFILVLSKQCTLIELSIDICIPTSALDLPYGT